MSKAGLVKLPDGTYVARGYGSMTYALLKSYILAGLKADDPRLEAAIDWLGKNYSWDENPGFEEMAKIKKDAPYQGLYYYYMTAGKALDLADDAGAKLDSPLDGWRSDLTGHILDRQSKDGWWVNDKSERWDEGNAVLCIAPGKVAVSHRVHLTHQLQRSTPRRERRPDRKGRGSGMGGKHHHPPP